MSHHVIWHDLECGAYARTCRSGASSPTAQRRRRSGRRLRHRPRGARPGALRPRGHRSRRRRRAARARCAERAAGAPRHDDRGRRARILARPTVRLDRSRPCSPCSCSAAPDGVRDSCAAPPRASAGGLLAIALADSLDGFDPTATCSRRPTCARSTAGLREPAAGRRGRGRRGGDPSPARARRPRRRAHRSRRRPARPPRRRRARTRGGRRPASSLPRRRTIPETRRLRRLDGGDARV